MIDLRQIPASTSATGFHWQVAQATSLRNIVVQMSTASGNNHQGVFESYQKLNLLEQSRVGMFMENGSGGFMGGQFCLVPAISGTKSYYYRPRVQRWKIWHLGRKPTVSLISAVRNTLVTCSVLKIYCSQYYCQQRCHSHLWSLELG